MIISICLMAAGESSRFKGEKLLHVMGNQTMSEHVLELINSLHFNDSIVLKKMVVTKPKLFDYFKAKTADHWNVIQNLSYKEGMSTSLKLAVFKAVQWKSDYILLFLGDMPMIQQTTVNAVISMIQQTPGQIIRPVVNSQPGFPVALPKILFSELSELTGDIGAKDVIQKHKEKLILIDSSDKGSIYDIDEEYWKK